MFFLGKHQAQNRHQIKLRWLRPTRAKSCPSSSRRQRWMHMAERRLRQQLATFAGRFNDRDKRKRYSCTTGACINGMNRIRAENTMSHNIHQYCDRSVLSKHTFQASSTIKAVSCGLIYTTPRQHCCLQHTHITVQEKCILYSVVGPLCTLTCYTHPSPQVRHRTTYATTATTKYTQKLTRFAAPVEHR